LPIFMSDSKYKYLNQMTPDTITRKRLLWYPVKTFDEMFNYLPGYYLKYMDVGQINQLNYEQRSDLIGVLRHGRPINDLIDGTNDLNLLSRNEVSEIELSDGYENTLYNTFNTVNIIDRQMFQFRPYTELSFYQDRYENLYLDANYHQNFFRNLNFNMGITKHSYDVHYVNSDFDKWLGRFNFNFAASNKLNFFLYSNYAKIQRGLNEGINPDTVDITDKSVMFDRAKAIVRNSDAYEIKERFDVDLGGVLLAGQNSFTKLQLFVSNSMRKYRDEENRPNPNGLYIKDDNHWINYGLKLQQIFNFKINKTIDIISRSEGEYDYQLRDISRNYFLIYPYSEKKSVYYLLENVDASYKKANLSGYVRWHAEDNFEKVYYMWGVKAGYSLNIDSANKFVFVAKYDNYNYSFSASLRFVSSFINLFSEYYMNSSLKHKGLNNSLFVRLWKIDLTGVYSYNVTRTEEVNLIPLHYGNVELAVHDVAFKNKLEYKIGFASRFWSEYRAQRFNGRLNIFRNAFVDSNYFNIPSAATLDFYIIGKIGKATFGLTLENIAYRLIYNTGIYPFMDRGGLFNVISRFNITWNFFD